MPHDVTMPQLGMAQDAGKIVSWLKAPGDKVVKGDTLFEVETDKATMEVEAQASGYLTDVTADAGDDVPVGRAIARISETAEGAGDSPKAPAPANDALPEGKPITMPQLGMAQDSGVIVGWLAEPGSEVGADDLLFEVETDKATMEVPAGTSGFLAATLAQAGEDVPVGQVVAVITAGKPERPVARSMVDAAPASADAAVAPKSDTSQEGTREPKPAKPAPTPQSGRILASPKLRRVAREKGLDLARLVQAGHPQPYHMRDLDLLESRGTDAPATEQAAAAAQAIRLEADCPQDGFGAFAAWAADAQGLDDADALLAGLAGAGMGGAATVAVDRFGARRVFAVPEGRNLSAVVEIDSPPDLLLRDLRATPLRAVMIGAEDLPVLTLMQQGAGLSLVLECSPVHMTPERAITLLSEFAGRMHDPLRHLL